MKRFRSFLFQERSCRITITGTTKFDEEIRIRGGATRNPWKVTRHRKNKSHGGVVVVVIELSLYVELKGYGKIPWGGGWSHASFSAASLPLSISPDWNKQKIKMHIGTPSDTSSAESVRNFSRWDSPFGQSAEQCMRGNTWLSCPFWITIRGTVEIKGTHFLALVI